MLLEIGLLKRLKQKQNKRCNKLCCSNGYIYHCLDYNSNIDNNKNPEMSKKKDFPKEKSALRGAEGSASLRYGSVLTAHGDS